MRTSKYHQFLPYILVYKVSILNYCQFPQYLFIFVIITRHEEDFKVLSISLIFISSILQYLYLFGIYKSIIQLWTQMITARINCLFRLKTIDLFNKIFSMLAYFRIPISQHLSHM